MIHTIWLLVEGLYKVISPSNEQDLTKYSQNNVLNQLVASLATGISGEEKERKGVWNIPDDYYLYLSGKFVQASTR